MITCRRATRDDVKLFREVRLHALQDSPDAFGSTYESASARDQASWEEQLFSTVSGEVRNTQFVFSGDECVGLAALYREPDDPCGEIIMMWVAPQYRGSTAASTLVDALIRWADGCGLRSVALVVSDSNLRAIKFYENQGFVSTGAVVDVDKNRNLRGIRMETQLREGGARQPTTAPDSKSKGNEKPNPESEGRSQ
jgi:ribosomal protein S18 acetylase RimI-like enzyme